MPEAGALDEERNSVHFLIAVRSYARKGRHESWQVEYFPGHFERIHHVRKKYACVACETNGDNPRIETAAKPETAIDKGLAGPGLLSYIVTSKFSDCLPLYRLEDIFARQGFEISRATQSVWCGDVGDLAEPLYELMGNEVRASHVVATDDTIMPMLRIGHCAKARMWVTAILASLTSTCRRHDIDRQLYLTQLLINLPVLRLSDLRDWLPDRWKAAQKTRLAALKNQAPHA